MVSSFFFFFSSRRRHTICALVTEFRRVLFRSLCEQARETRCWPMRTTGIFKTAVAATALACTLAACGGTTESGGDGTGAVNPNGEFVIASITDRKSVV